VSESTGQRLLLIDGHSMAFRAFFALPAEKFSNSAGQNTNAVYGFVSMLITLIAEEKPTHVAVAFDTSAPTFRSEEYGEYKGGRDATPEAFKGQVPLLAEVLRAAGFATLSLDGFEADDILATLAAAGSEGGMEVAVVSGDRDAFQLVDDRVTVLYPVKGVSTVARMTPTAVEEKYGVPPHRYPELAALTGEQADNLPGVPGVGPKTAAKWIGQFDGLDNIIARADEVPGKAGQSLRDHLSDVVRNRRLNHLLTDVDLGLTPGDLAPSSSSRPCGPACSPSCPTTARPPSRPARRSWSTTSTARSPTGWGSGPARGSASSSRGRAGRASGRPRPSRSPTTTPTP
jgi:DNA polymerase-1